MAVVSVLPAEYRPPRYDRYGPADNWLLWSESRYMILEMIEDVIYQSDGDIEEDDVWVMCWKVHWDTDEVVDEHESGITNDDGTPEMVQYTVYEYLEMGEEMISSDNYWLGSEIPWTDEEVKRTALRTFGDVTGLPQVMLGFDVFDPIVVPLVEWKLILSNGRYRKVG